MGGSRSPSEFVFLENHPNIADILEQYTMCITLLKVVNAYDLSVLCMSVMGFQKKFGWGGGGWVG